MQTTEGIEVVVQQKERQIVCGKIYTSTVIVRGCLPPVKTGAELIRIVGNK